MQTMRKLTGLLLMLFGFSIAEALPFYVTINFGSPQLLDSASDPLVDGSLVLLLSNVATPSTSGAGFGTLSAGTLNVGDMLGAYQILGRASVSEFSLPGEFADTTGFIELTTSPFPNLSTGDQLAVAWFSTLTGASDYSLVGGTSYGLYTIDSSSAWQIPTAGTTLDVTVPSGTAASFTAIPEPAAYAALAGLFALTLAAVRRRTK